MAAIFINDKTKKPATYAVFSEFNFTGYSLACIGFWQCSGQLFITDSTVADRSIAEALITEFQAEYLPADRGYGTDAIIRCALQAEMSPVMPPKKNRKILREYDKHIYKLRHLVENIFLHLKKWRIATRYAKNVAPFVAAVQVRCIALWLKIY